jgi:hypothetical protein
MVEDWNQVLAAFGESLRVLPRVLEGVSAERLRREPMILRLILTEDCPTLPNMDGDNRLCATRFAPLYPDTATALGVWRTLREDNLRLCASVAPDDLARVGRAPWRKGERITLRSYVATRGRHERAHNEQIRAALSG